MHGYSGKRDEHLNRLRRIEGQVRGLHRMVSEDVYCIDILTQVSAVTRALQSFALELLGEHMAGCVLDAAQSSPTEGQAKLQEAHEAVTRLVRS